MAGILTAIGLVSQALGLVSFLKSNLPGSSPQGASLRIKVGLEEKHSDNYVSTLSSCGMPGLCSLHFK